MGTSDDKNFRGAYRKRLRYFADGVVLGSRGFEKKHLEDLVDKGIYKRRKDPIEHRRQRSPRVSRGKNQKESVRGGTSAEIGANEMRRASHRAKYYLLRAGAVRGGRTTPRSSLSKEIGHLKSKNALRAVIFWKKARFLGTLNDICPEMGGNWALGRILESVVP